MSDDIPTSLTAWMEHYLQQAVTGIRSEAVTPKTSLQLQRFQRDKRRG